MGYSMGYGFESRLLAEKFKKDLESKGREVILEEIEYLNPPWWVRDFGEKEDDRTKKI